jgi:ABC-type arginine transport system permease subunit
MRYRMFPELLAIAFFFYGIHTVIDSTSESVQVTRLIAEESAKLICGTFLALATFTGFLGALWNSAPCEAPDNND